MTVARSNVDKAAVLAAARAQIDAWKRAVQATEDVVGLDAGWYDGCDFGDQPDGDERLTDDIRSVTEADLEGFGAVIHRAAISNDPVGHLSPDATLFGQRGGCDPRRSDSQAGRRWALPPLVVLRAVRRIAAAELLPVEGALLEHRSPHGGSWIPELSARGLSEVDAGPTDVVVDAFGMMHDASTEHAALRSRVDELGPAGVLFLQFHSVAAILRQEMWNALRHGHFAYYSTPVVVAMAEELGLDAIGVWEFDLYGGTVMLAFTRNGVRSVQVDRLIERETELGVSIQ